MSRRESRLVRVGRFLRRVGPFLRERYLVVDTRSAAIFRIALSVMLIADTIRHASYTELLYANTGVFSNDYHLYKPSVSSYSISLFHAFSTSREVMIAFAIGILLQLFLLVGYRTRAASIATLVFVVSRGARIPLIENGGYIVQNLACLYACFLPLGERFSVDAWQRSWRARKETTLEELPAARELRAPSVRRSLIGLMVVTNLVVIYFFNVINKTGDIWREGTTVHYVLHIDRMVTGLGVFTREHFPLALLKAADFGTLAVEATICVFIASPFARRLTRPLAMLLMVGLHTTLGTFMRLGPFSWFLIVWSTLLLLPIHYERLARRDTARARPCELGVDSTNPFAMAFGRVVARLDHHARVSFVEPPAGSSLAVRSRGEDAWSSDPRQVVDAVALALPFGWLLGRVVPVRPLVAALVSRSAGVTRFLGLDVAPTPDARTEPSPLGKRLARAGVFLREGALLYLIVCATMQTWIENKVIPKSLPPPLKEGQVLKGDEKGAYEFLKRNLGDRVIPLKPEKSPAFLQATITYPRIFQGWGMFAPNPIRDDGVLAVDALTRDGRHIDPLTGRAPDLDLTDSRGEGLSQIRQDYGNRIRLDRNEGYRDQLRDYLGRYPERTGNPNDELVAIDVYWVKDFCPPPGKSKPSNNDAIPILSWRKPGFRPTPEVPKLPPKLKTRSADKDDDEKKK